MTDTTATTVKRSTKPRDVDYTLEVLEGDLPEMELTRRSPLEDQLDAIKADPKFHGKFVRIASYGNGTAATASANVLRQRHGGDKTVEGWSFKPKRYEHDDTAEDGTVTKETRTGLFARFDPTAVVNGARDEWDRKEKTRKAELAAAREAAKADNGKSGKGAKSTSTTAKSSG